MRRRRAGRSNAEHGDDHMNARRQHPPARSDRRKFVREDVRVDDAELSPEANRLLTEELQDALGTDQVELPADRARVAHALPSGDVRGVRAVIGENRMLVAVVFVALLVVGAIISLATGSWWAVVAACAVHAAGTLVVATIVLRATTAVEHAAPETAARLQEEGVGDPDQALSDLVKQFTPDGDARGVDHRPGEDQARAAGEQAGAGTPSTTPTEPAGFDGTPAILPAIAVAGSVIVGIAVAIVEGGIAWLGALLLVGASLGWLLIERGIARGAHRRRMPLLVTAALVVAAGVAGVIIVGAVAGYLG